MQRTMRLISAVWSFYSLIKIVMRRIQEAAAANYQYTGRSIKQRQIGYIRLHYKEAQGKLSILDASNNHEVPAS